MVKKVVFGGVLLALVFVAVVAFRTVRFESKQIDVDPAPRLAFDVEAAAARLAMAISHKTVSHQDPADFDGRAFDRLHGLLEASFPRVHATLKKEVIGRWSLLYTWEGSDASLKPVVLMGHMDVVPVAPGTEDDWEHEAFKTVIEDGWIYGRGALDDKVDVLATLQAVELLLAEGAEPKRTVYLAFGHDEEVGGPNGAAAMAELLYSRGVEAEFVLDEGGVVITGAMPGIDAPVATIGVAEKGYISVELSVKTQGGHSSQPPKETAIGILSHAIYRLETHQMPGGIGGLVGDMFEYLGPEMDWKMKTVVANLWLFTHLVETQLGDSPVMNAFMRTTTAPTIIEGGVKDNVLPSNVRAVVNFRILPGDTCESVVRHVRRTVRDDRVTIRPFTEDAHDPSRVSPSSGPAFDLINRTIREVIPEAIVAPFLVIAATDSRHYEIISDNVYRFSPVILTSEDLPRIHGTNERISVENYGTAIRFYHRLLQNAAM